MYCTRFHREFFAEKRHGNVHWKTEVVSRSDCFQSRKLKKLEKYKLNVKANLFISKKEATLDYSHPSFAGFRLMKKQKGRIIKLARR